MSVVLNTDDIVQLRVWVQDFEQASVNTFYWKATGFNTEGVTVQDVVDAFNALVAPLWKPVIYDGAVYRGVQGRDISHLPLTIEDVTIVSAGACTGGVEGLPRQVSGLIGWKTTKAGPGGRGRTYMPFPPSSANQNAGVPTAGYVSALTTIGIALLDFVNVPKISVGLDGRLVLKVKPGLASLDIDHSVASSLWAEQRRRGSYGRPNNSPI